MLSYLIEKIDKLYHIPKISNFFLKEKINTYIDIGGYKGLYSNIFLKKANKIFIFEPQKKYFEFLRSKFQSNKKVKIFNNALGKENKISFLQINFLESTSTLSKINFLSKWYRFKKFLFFKNKIVKDKYRVKIKKLDSINEISKIKDISLIKIDTEGYEMNVLDGAKKILKKTKFLLIELHHDNMYKNYSRKKIDKYIKKNNFIFLKKFKFPFIPFYDYIYINSKFIKRY